MDPEELDREHGEVVRCGDGITEDGVPFAAYLHADGWERIAFVDSRPYLWIGPEEEDGE